MTDAVSLRSGSMLCGKIRFERKTSGNRSPGSGNFFRSDTRPILRIHHHHRSSSPLLVNMVSLGSWSSSDLVRGATQVGLGIGLSAAVYGLSGLHFRSLFSYFFRSPSRDGWTLDFGPTDIGWADRTFLLLFGVLNKAVQGLFGSSLNVRGKETVQLPRLDLRCPVEVRAEHRELFSKAFDRGEVQQGGLAESFLLAALTNQLMLLLVVHPRLPVSPLGAVNVRNRIEFHQHPLDLQQPLKAHAYVGGKDNLGRVTHRGVELDIHIDVFASSDNLALRQVITILSPCKTTVPRPADYSQTEEPPRNWQTIGNIHMPTSAPGRWSKVCGDYNPIHVSSLLAKLFGFPGKMAHGNHVVAKAISLIGSHPKSAEMKGAWWIEMHFKRPMVLPIQLTVQLDKSQWRCVKDDKPYVEGSIGQL